MALGCTTNEAYVYDRGGTRRIGVLDRMIDVTYQRVRDDISNCVLHVSPRSPQCAALLGSLEPGRHEVVVFRAGKRVWEGPITRIGYGRTSVEVEARDVLHYGYRTILRSEWDNSYPNIVPVTERAAAMIRGELARKEALDPPINVLPYLDVRTTANTANTSRRTLPYQKTLWEDIDDLAQKAGLDYTVVGRSIILFDTHEPIGSTAPMTQDDFIGEVIVTVYGMELATYSAVTDGEGLWGAVGGTDDYYGLVELLHTAYSEAETRKEVTADEDPITEEELISQARRNLDGRYPTPAVVRIPDGSMLNPTTTALVFDDLVPGVRIPLRAGLSHRVVNQDQKLDQVTVREDSSGEQVTVVLSPAPGSSPWDDDLGESSS